MRYSRAMGSIEVVRGVRRALVGVGVVGCLMLGCGGSDGPKRYELSDGTRVEVDANGGVALRTAEGRALAAAASPAPALEGAPTDASTADALDGLLRALLAARGGVAFGVCRTCRFHEARAGGRHCGLLDVPLGEAQADRVCVEHAAQ